MKKILFLALSMASAYGSSQQDYFTVEIQPGNGKPRILPGPISPVSIDLSEESSKYVNVSTLIGAGIGFFGGYALSRYVLDCQNTALNTCSSAGMGTALGALFRVISKSNTPEKTVESMYNSHIKLYNSALAATAQEAWHTLQALNLSPSCIASDRKGAYQALDKTPLAACTIITAHNNALIDQNKKIDLCCTDATSRTTQRQELQEKYRAYLNPSCIQMLNSRDDALTQNIRTLPAIRESNQQIIDVARPWLTVATKAEEVSRERIAQQIAEFDKKIKKQEYRLQDIIGEDIYIELIRAAIRDESANLRKYASLNKTEIMRWQNSYHELIHARNKLLHQYQEVDHRADEIFREYADIIKYKEPKKDISTLISWLNIAVFVRTITSK